MGRRKSGVWDKKTGRRSFRNSNDAAKYFYEELRLILNIPPDKFARDGFGIKFEPLIFELAIEPINAESSEEALAFVMGMGFILDALASKILLNKFTKEAYIYGVVKSQQGGDLGKKVGLEELWKGSGYGENVVGEKAYTVEADRVSKISDPQVQPWVPKYRGFKGARRATTLSDIGEAIRESFEGSVKVVDGVASLPSPMWYSKQEQFKFSSKNSTFRSAFMLLEFGSGREAANVRPFYSGRATPYKVPPAFGHKGEWVTSKNTARKIRKLISVADKPKSKEYQYHMARVDSYSQAIRSGRKPREVMFDKRGQYTLQREHGQEFIRASRLRFMQLLNEYARRKLGKRAKYWQNNFLYSLVEWRT